MNTTIQMLRRRQRLKTKLSVIIPNYNGLAYIEACMDSLFKQQVSSFEIIVVDDASTDGSLAFIKDKYPQNDTYPRVRYIVHRDNLGFARSVNDGIWASQSDYVLLLNNDTVVEADFVYRMYKAIRRSDSIFSVSARMVNLYDRNRMDNAGDFYNILGWARTPAKDKPLSDFDKKKKIFSSCGGAAIYRKSILKKIGTFDDAHFAYLEDVDLGYRSQLYGYTNIYEPKAIVYHAGSATSGSRYNDFKARLTARNNVYVIYKNMPNWQIALNCPFIVAGFAIKTLFYFKKGFGNSYLKGLLEGLRTAKGLKRVDFKAVGLRRLAHIEAQLLAATRY